MIKIVKRDDYGDWEDVPFVDERAVRTDLGIGYDTLESGSWEEAYYWCIETRYGHIPLPLVFKPEKLEGKKRQWAEENKDKVRQFLLDRVPKITKGTLMLNFGFFDWNPEEWDKEKFLSYALFKSLE